MTYGRSIALCTYVLEAFPKKQNNLTRSELYPRERDTPYNSLYWETPPERDTFFSLQVYERVGKSVVSFCKIGPKGMMMHFMQGVKKLIFQVAIGAS